MSLEGKTALITAAGHGIGRASALELAARCAEVIATDIDVKAVETLASETDGGTGKRLDVSDAKAVESLISAALSTDILVNCADSGSIANIASFLSSLKGAPRRCAYGSSKAAITGLTRAIAADFVKNGLPCHAVCPDTVECPSLKQRLEATGDYEKAHDTFKVRQPTGRLGTPDEIAEMVCYLAGNMPTFTTGQAFSVDGGWST